MYWFLALIIFLAWGLERYFKLFSRFAKGVKSGVVSAVLLGAFALIVAAEAVNGHYFRAGLLVVLAVIAYINFRRPVQNAEEEEQP